MDFLNFMDFMDFMYFMDAIGRHRASRVGSLQRMLVARVMAEGLAKSHPPVLPPCVHRKRSGLLSGDR